MRLNLLVGAVLSCSLLVVAPASTSAVASGFSSAAWEVDLGDPGPGSTNVVVDGGVRLGSGDNRAASAGASAGAGAGAGVRTGFAVYPRRLGAPANSFTAVVRSNVPAGTELAVDVRGRTNNQWTEWVEILPGVPGVLPAVVTDIEARVMLARPDGVASPSLEGLSVSSASVPAGREPAGAVTATGLSYPVFATREGLVGGTTANGHRIVARDHFVALPSRRGLAGRNGGEYSVRVCAANGRCAWAPVWDVGPWNTRDDYWAGPGVRQEWHDLPQGRPASQAAYQDGYNGGKDQFGRKVANPAGIDLADGTFWDGLKLKNNAWVTVTYQWTAGGPSGYVRTPGDTLNVRNGPNSRSAVVGIAGNHAQTRIECAVAGEQVAGTQGTTNAWYRLAPGMFVSAAYVASGGGVPGC
jgi:hypothetical protein